MASFVSPFVSGFVRSHFMMKKSFASLIVGLSLVLVSFSSQARQGIMPQPREGQYSEHEKKCTSLLNELQAALTEQRQEKTNLSNSQNSGEKGRVLKNREIMLKLANLRVAVAERKAKETGCLNPR